MPRRHAVALAVVAACLGGCAGPQASPRSTAPAGETSSLAAPSTHPAAPVSGLPDNGSAEVPPLGPDLACFNRTRCYLKNPRKLSDEQMRRHFATVVGAGQPPSPRMRPWAYVVLGLGNGRIHGVDAPDAAGRAVDDEIGILNHRALFAYCRRADGGLPVTPTTPAASTWYRIEPVTRDAPAEVWVNGKHLVAYGHDGAIPAC